LFIIRMIGTGGGTGHVIEYSGEAIRAMTMEQRMTLCNMSIEAGARAAMIAPDEVTFAYLEGRTFAPKGDAFQRAVERWKALSSEPDAIFDRDLMLNVSTLAPQVTWGTNPGMVTDVTGC